MPPHLLNQVAYTTQYFEYNVNNRIHVIILTHSFCSLEWQKHRWVTMREACYFVIKAICFWGGEDKWKSSGTCNKTLTPTPGESKDRNNFTYPKIKNFFLVHFSTLLSTYKPYKDQNLRANLFQDTAGKQFIYISLRELLYNTRSTLHFLL